LAELTLTEALELAHDVVVESEDGSKWIRIDALRKLEAGQREEKTKEKLAQGPPPRNFEQARALALQDQELQESFADRPPVLGPSPAAARA
jgi:hypothetical protein